ncbi:MAG: zinc ribbon domain-containing protein [Rikenellaceae bacterium]
MALINCPECGKEISDKAISCPNCGVPLSKEISQLEEKNEEQVELLSFPNLPGNLDIGRQITNWAFDAAFEGFFDGRENTLPVIPSGKVTVLLHTHGIQLMSGLKFYSIHNSQIISLKTVSKEELVKTDKSVIGRAVVGGLILGPLGAIVGGMSGIGSKEKFINKQYFIINFWDKITQSAQSILISSTEGLKINSFIARQAKENSLNITDNREPEPNTMPGWAILCIVVFIISVIIIIATL